MTTETDIRTVTLTVDGIRGKRDGHGGSSQLSVYANIPALGSQYPTGPLWVDESHAPVAGQTYTVQIRKGNLKKDKDGSRDWDYWWEVDIWDVQGVAPDPVQPRQAPAEPSNGKQGGSTTAGRQEAVRVNGQKPYVDPTRISIERQTSAKEATQIVLTIAPAALANGLADGKAMWQEWAEHIYGWISDRPQPTATEQGTPDGTSFDDLPSASEAEGTGPGGHTGAEIFAWIKKATDFFSCTRDDIVQALGVQPKGIGDFDKAWKKLEEAFSNG